MAEFYSLTFILLIKLFQLIIVIRKNGKKLTFYVEHHSFAFIFDHEYAYQWILPFSYYIRKGFILFFDLHFTDKDISVVHFARLVKHL